MSKDDVIETEGVIVEALPNATFTVKLSNGHVITAYISGKLRMHYIKIIPGDSVKLEIAAVNGSEYSDVASLPEQGGKFIIVSTHCNPVSLNNC